MTTKMKNIMILLKDIPKSVNFYQKGLDCKVNYSSEHWAELQSGNYTIHLNRVESEASTTSGYTPFLCFDVENLDKVIHKLIELGGAMDGPIKYPAHGKIASIRSPDGQMIGLFEENKHS
eukprot:gene6641-10806_t